MSDFPRETASVKDLQLPDSPFRVSPIAHKSAQRGHLRISFATNGDNVGLKCLLEASVGTQFGVSDAGYRHPLDSGQGARRYSLEAEASL
jgi:hypothetical protein